MLSDFFNLPKSTPIRALTSGYILALIIIGCMSLVIHYGIGEIIKQQNNRDLVFASRQLKLIPMITLNIRDYADTKNKLIKVDAVNNLDLLKSSYKQLFRDGQGILKGKSKTFYAVQVEESQKRAMQDIGSFITHAENFLNTNIQNINLKNPDYKAIDELMQGALLQNIDSLNIAYEAESLEYIRRLQTYQYLALIIILVTLLLEALFIFMPLVKRVRIYANTLEGLAKTDSLTGVDNRRSIMEKGIKEIGRARRNKRDLSVAMLDIDHFKIINDEHGHGSGDMILKSVVKTIQDNIRLEDEIGRYGGEEFLIVLPNTSVTDSLVVLERIRQAVEIKEFRVLSGAYIKVTVSMGVAAVNLDDEKSLDPVIRRADIVLYKAKESGRNKIKTF